MISHEHRFIFIHIPKCAGTSIEMAMGKARQDHRSIRMIEPLSEAGFRLTRENLATVLRRGAYRCRGPENQHNRVTVGKEQYRTYFKFSFVRNPWARAFSWYRNVVRDPRYATIYGTGAETPFSDFVRKHAGKGPLRPQLHWITDFRGAIPLDYIGRFERLQDDFGEICRSLGIARITLPHKMRGTGEDYRDHYDADSIETVAKVYAEEIALFGYSFGE